MRTLQHIYICIGVLGNFENMYLFLLCIFQYFLLVLILIWKTTIEHQQKNGILVKHDWVHNYFIESKLIFPYAACIWVTDINDRYRKRHMFVFSLNVFGGDLRNVS